MLVSALYITINVFKAFNCVYTRQTQHKYIQAWLKYSVLKFIQIQRHNSILVLHSIMNLKLCCDYEQFAAR